MRSGHKGGRVYVMSSLVTSRSMVRSRVVSNVQSSADVGRWTTPTSFSRSAINSSGKLLLDFQIRSCASKNVLYGRWSIGGAGLIVRVRAHSVAVSDSEGLC